MIFNLFGKPIKLSKEFVNLSFTLAEQEIFFGPIEKNLTAKHLCSLVLKLTHFHATYPSSF